jgi:hypothetical protein
LTNNPNIAVDKNHDLYRRLEKSKIPDSLKSELKKNYDGYFEILKTKKGEKNPVSYMHDSLMLSTALGKRFVGYENRRTTLDENGVMKFSNNGRPTVVSKDKADYQGFMKFLKKSLPF